VEGAKASRVEALGVARADVQLIGRDGAADGRVGQGTTRPVVDCDGAEGRIVDREHALVGADAIAGKRDHLLEQQGSVGQVAAIVDEFADVVGNGKRDEIAAVRWLSSREPVEAERHALGAVDDEMPGEPREGCREQHGRGQHTDVEPGEIAGGSDERGPTPAFGDEAAARGSKRRCGGGFVSSVVRQGGRGAGGSHARVPWTSDRGLDPVTMVERERFMLDHGGGPRNPTSLSGRGRAGFRLRAKKGYRLHERSRAQPIRSRTRGTGFRSRDGLLGGGRLPPEGPRRDAW
jgi:hypothetical protein